MSIAAIRYQGHLDDVSQREAALRMIRAWCDERGWVCYSLDFELRGPHFMIQGDYAYEVEMDTRWRGWSIDPHVNCDSLVLAFDDEGWLLLSFDTEAGDRMVKYDLAVTTQYAPPSVHAEICKLLCLLKKRFAQQGLVVYDPTGYFNDCTE